jgi:hypothetical protein
MTTTLPDKYVNAEYQEAHRLTFAHPHRHSIPKVLPPGVGEDAFARVIQELLAAVGKDFVFVGDGLSDYIDPYDIWEADESKRKLPSAAVWCVHCPGDARS